MTELSDPVPVGNFLERHRERADKLGRRTFMGLIGGTVITIVGGAIEVVREKTNAMDQTSAFHGINANLLHYYHDLSFAGVGALILSGVYGIGSAYSLTREHGAYQAGLEAGSALPPTTATEQPPSDSAT